jgi:hypothetical protein
MVEAENSCDLERYCAFAFPQQATAGEGYLGELACRERVDISIRTRQNSMDYKGQRLSEYIYSIITILFGAIAWIVGYVKGDFQITVYGWAGGLVLALLVCYSGVTLCTMCMLC